MKTVDDFLAPAVLQIILPLTGEDLRGYGIMQELIPQSGGRHKPGPGTLYDNLQRRVKHGGPEPTGEEPEFRRSYYRLSAPELERDQTLREIAMSGDRNHDGFTSLNELTPQLPLRAKGNYAEMDTAALRLPLPADKSVETANE